MKIFAKCFHSLNPFTCRASQVQNNLFSLRLMSVMNIKYYRYVKSLSFCATRLLEMWNREMIRFLIWTHCCWFQRVFTLNDMFTSSTVFYENNDSFQCQSTADNYWNECALRTKFCFRDSMISISLDWQMNLFYKIWFWTLYTQRKWPN